MLRHATPFWTGARTGLIKGPPNPYGGLNTFETRLLFTHTLTYPQRHQSIPVKPEAPPARSIPVNTCQNMTSSTSENIPQIIISIPNSHKTTRRPSRNKPVSQSNRTPSLLRKPPYEQPYDLRLIPATMFDSERHCTGRRLRMSIGRYVPVTEHPTGIPKTPSATDTDRPIARAQSLNTRRN